MFWTTAAHAMGGAPPAEGGAPMWGSLLPIIAMFGIFYFLLIRPQQKKAKEHRELITSVKRGDEVVTAGGFHGRVTETGDDYVMIDLGSTVAKISRSSIAVVRSAGSQAADRKSKKDAAKLEAKKDDSKDGDEK